MGPEGGTAAENELEAVVDERAVGEEERVVWMARWEVDVVDAEFASEHRDVHVLDVFRRQWEPVLVSAVFGRESDAISGRVWIILQSAPCEAAGCHAQVQDLERLNTEVSWG